MPNSWVSPFESFKDGCLPTPPALSKLQSPYACACTTRNFLFSTIWINCSGIAQLFWVEWHSTISICFRVHMLQPSYLLQSFPKLHKYMTWLHIHDRTETPMTSMTIMTWPDMNIHGKHDNFHHISSLYHIYICIVHYSLQICNVLCINFQLMISPSCMAKHFLSPHVYCSLA